MATETKTNYMLGPLRVGMVVAFAERDNHGAHGKKTAIELDDRTGETVAYVIRPEHVALFSAAPDMLAALKAMQKAYEQLIPNLAHGTCQDYAIVNEAPILAARAIAKAEK